MKYCVPLSDMEAIWKSPAGSALVEAALDDYVDGDASLVTVFGADCVVLGGTTPRLAALVVGLLGTRLGNRHVVVYGDDGRGWRRVHTPPVVAELPDDSPTFDDPDGEEALCHV